MSAERLREAARVLRLVIGKLTTDTERWDEAFTGWGVYGDHSSYERLIVHPGVGLALADWLDDAATWMSKPGTANYDGSAIRVADLILGGES